MVKVLSGRKLQKKNQISLRQIALIILAIVVALAFYFVLRGIRNDFLPK